MPEEKLDLIQLTAGEMTQTCAGAPEIMRCELLNAGSGRGIFHYFPENLRRHPVSPDSASLVDRAEHSTGRDVRRFCPVVHGPLHPKRNRNLQIWPPLPTRSAITQCSTRS